MPVFLILVAFLLDVSGAFVQQARLQNMADSGADAAMTKLVDLMVEKAEAHEANPPPNTDPRQMLTDQDRQALLLDNRVSDQARAYVEKNRQAYQLSLTSVTLRYPVTAVDCSNSARQNAELRLTLSTSYTYLLGQLLNASSGKRVEATARQFIRLCP